METAILDHLSNHRSIRKFKDDPIELEVMEAILHAGTRAANTRNLQAYSFMVVEGEKLKELGWTRFPAAVFALVDQYRVERWLELNDAPFHYDCLQFFLLSYWDAILALQNVIVAAESVGLGTVCLNTALLIDVWETFDCPELTFPAGMVVMGYPDETPDLKPRMPLNAVVHHNEYHMPTDEEIRDWFAKIDATFNGYDDEKKAELRAKGVTNYAQDHAVARVHAKRVEEENARILEHLRKAGFQI